MQLGKEEAEEPAELHHASIARYLRKPISCAFAGRNNAQSDV
jgi:hypothetical protein